MKSPLSHWERVPAKRRVRGCGVSEFAFPSVQHPLNRRLRQTPSPSGRRLGRALLLPFLTLSSPAFADEPVDLELVLAIDASSSVEEAEWQLQREGYAAAFRDP